MTHPERSTTLLPWAPVLNIRRGSLAEVTVYGIVTALIPEKDILLSVGESDNRLWSRSLLKPWQLLVNLPRIKTRYPALSGRHWAVMAGSHQGDPAQLQVLEELDALAGEAALQCPACYPMGAQNARQLQDQGCPPSVLYHPCSGKHLAHRLAWPDEPDYLDTAHPAYAELRHILSQWLRRQSVSFEGGIDSCGMPNMALSAEEMACLYAWLAGSTDEPAPEIREAMQAFPELVGGEGRLDTRLMRGELTDAPDLSIVAKEGADGLLGIGVAPCEKYPDGLGMLVKLAEGYNPAHLEAIAVQLLYHLGLRQTGYVLNDPLSADFNPALDGVGLTAKAGGRA